MKIYAFVLIMSPKLKMCITWLREFKYNAYAGKFFFNFLSNFFRGNSNAKKKRKKMMMNLA